MSLPLLEHTGQLTAVVERLSYTFGFGGASYADPARREELFDSYASRLPKLFAGLFGMPMREAWAEASEILEDADVRWAYLRAGAGTYQERTREAAGPSPDRTFHIASGTC